jgi:hypothetical protein
MYGKDKPLSSNSPINNIIKNITPNNIDYNTNSYETEIKHNNSLNINSQSSGLSVTGQIIFVIFILLLLGIVYFFKDTIYKNIKDLWNQFYNNNSKLEEQVSKLMKDNETKKEEENKKKKKEEELKKEKSQIEQEKEKEKNKELEKNGGLNQLNNKVNLSKYRKDQIATSNGFCYIGYDLGQRECTDIYAGEVCLSGQIFPSMNVCVNPKFRN